MINMAAANPAAAMIAPASHTPLAMHAIRAANAAAASTIPAAISSAWSADTITSTALLLGFS